MKRDKTMENQEIKRKKRKEQQKHDNIQVSEPAQNSKIMQQPEDSEKTKVKHLEVKRRSEVDIIKLVYDCTMLLIVILTLLVTIFIGVKANKISELSLKVQRDTLPLIVDIDRTNEEQFSVKRQQYMLPFLCSQGSISKAYLANVSDEGIVYKQIQLEEYDADEKVGFEVELIQTRELFEKNKTAQFGIVLYDYSGNPHLYYCFTVYCPEMNTIVSYQRANGEKTEYSNWDAVFFDCTLINMETIQEKIEERIDVFKKSVNGQELPYYYPEVTEMYTNIKRIMSDIRWN